MYSYWPKLKLQISPIPNNNTNNNDDNKEENEVEEGNHHKQKKPQCQVILQWEPRTKIQQMFRHPDSYHPNVNCI